MSLVDKCQICSAKLSGGYDFCHGSAVPIQIVGAVEAAWPQADRTAPNNILCRRRLVVCDLCGLKAGKFLLEDFDGIVDNLVRRIREAK